MNQRNWFQLSNCLIEAYKINDISFRLKNLPLQYFYTAAAPFSGPIAILYNKFIDQQYKFSQGDDKSILIFNCKGQPKKSIPYQLKDRVILFQFTQLEQLLIVYANGSYSLIDVFSSYIYESTYFSNAINPQKERCVGADIVKDTLIIIKERQIGFVKSIKGQWQNLPFIKIGFENPVFSMESDQFKNISVTYLTKEATIQSFSFLTNSKKLIFSHQYLSTNWKKLVTLSKKNQKMCLIFKQPYKVFYVDLSSNILPNDKQIKIHELLIDMKSNSQINKKKSFHTYKEMNAQICWLNQFVFYSNKKLTVIFDDTSQKAIFKTTKIICQVDGIRIIGQQTTIYRIVNHIYQELVSYQSFEQYQRNIVNSVANQKSSIKDLSKTDPQTLSLQQKLKIIHQLHKIYQKFINKEMIQLEELSKFKKVVGVIFKEIVQNGIKCLDKLELIKILKFSTFLQNYFIPQKSLQNNNESKSLQTINNEKYNKEQFEKEFEYQGISSYLPVSINQLCNQLRIINELKYSYLQRFLTIEQFHYLKQDKKEVFVKIFLKYNMHYELDLIFGDTETKEKIFYHWMKCKIEKWENKNSTKSVKNSQNQNSLQLSQNNLQNQLVREINQRYTQLKKNLTSTIVFSQISKYCVDRDKLSLALKLIEYEQHTERRIIVGLLILVAKKDKNMIPKIIEFTQMSKQSSIIYRVIKQLLGFTWVQKYLWINILYNKPNFKEHYLKYLAYLEDEDLRKSFYLQNKLFFDLGYHNVKIQLKEVYIKRKNELKKMQDYQQKNVFTLNKQQNEKLISSIAQNCKQLCPSLATNIKKYKKRTSVQALKVLQKKKEQITQKDTQDFKTDLQNQYLGQIILTKDKNEILAIKIFSKIKTDKCYNILMKMGRFRQSIDLAFNRRNRQKILQIMQLSEQTENYCKTKLAQFDKKR